MVVNSVGLYSACLNRLVKGVVRVLWKLITRGHDFVFLDFKNLGLFALSMIVVF
ncbi:MAG: hypothetical protein CM1200mP30_32830 [Pseudomonadota bacterium]|nr:MAG: hypothetical protein CM1200mP30_32830 [Pseudomonadota bacterium]